MQKQRLRMIRLGLTGSIATGKSTTAQLFAEEGVPVHDADAAVHAIYSQEGVAPVGALIPTAIVDNVVDREALKKALAERPIAFSQAGSDCPSPGSRARAPRRRERLGRRA
jgi:dephospho-CoA kinase